MLARVALGLAGLVAAVSQAAVVNVFSDVACSTQTATIAAYSGYCFGGLAFKDTYRDPNSAAGWAKVAIFSGAACTGTSAADVVVSTSTCVALPGKANTYVKLAASPVFTTSSTPLVMTVYDNTACTFNANAVSSATAVGAGCIGYGLLGYSLKFDAGTGSTTTIKVYSANDYSCSNAPLVSYTNVPNSGTSCIAAGSAIPTGSLGAAVGIASAVAYTAPAVPTPIAGGFQLSRTFATTTCPTNAATAPAKSYVAYAMNSCTSSDGITSTMPSCVENAVLTFTNSAYCTGTFTKTSLPSSFGTCAPGSGSYPASIITCGASALTASSFMTAAQLTGTVVLAGTYTGSTCSDGTLVSINAMNSCSNAPGTTISTAYSCSSSTSFTYTAYSASATCTGASTAQTVPSSALTCTANSGSGTYNQIICGGASAAASSGALPAAAAAGVAVFMSAAAAVAQLL